MRRNCVIEQVIEGNIQRRVEVTERRGRRRKRLLEKDDWKMKREALGRCVWETHLGRGYGPIVRGNTE